MMDTLLFQDGWNEAATDYDNRKMRDTSLDPKDYQEGYEMGWEHNANIGPTHSTTGSEVCPECGDSNPAENKLSYSPLWMCVCGKIWKPKSKK